MTKLTGPKQPKNKPQAVPTGSQTKENSQFPQASLTLHLIFDDAQGSTRLTEITSQSLSKSLNKAPFHWMCVN